MSDGNQHLIDLEIKISHHEMAIEKLQQAVFDQQELLDQQDKALKLLNTKLEALLRGDDTIGPADEKPPHY